MLIFLERRFKRAYLLFENTKRKKESLIMRYEEEEGHDCGICGDSSAEEVNEKEYSGYKYLCSHCKACNNPNFFPR